MSSVRLIVLTARNEKKILCFLCRSGVSVPGIRMVDATEGILGIEWIEGKSVRLLLGGGAEDEQATKVDDFFSDEEQDEPQEEVDSLLEYELTLGLVLKFLKITSAETTLCRQTNGLNWHRDRQNAPSRCYSRRSHYLEHDDSASIRC
jgi:hypothetical protein